MGKLIAMLSAMSILDAYFIEDALDSLVVRLRTAKDSDCREIADAASMLLDEFDGKTISGESPLVLVDKARHIRDHAAARATLHELKPANSRASKHRIARITRLKLN